ncbi:FG-GAP repeat domain-containing protein [Bathymodiolus japonicus methanotrophic gill symbiont]|uniref:FG-GAP repeat domain-containing protein n=1 Tax=Bathymodiolus japonicus methanotrophic gill symbiont TaxID=113269 RepID=UPI001C8F1119|nr:VCBS repeat-containing protein [Bathymodiolus japonicus methanotrophic gill symbiont]
MGYNGVGIISNENNNAMFSFASGDKDGKLTLAEDRMELGRFSPTDKSEDAFTFMAFDKNGDGLNDLVKIIKGDDGIAYAKTFLSSAGKPNFDADPIVQNLGNKYVDTGKMRATYTGRDINGDGLHDIVVMMPHTDQPTSTYDIVVHYAAVAGGFPTHDDINGQIENTVIPTVDQSINFADYDKDTLSDFFLLKKSDDSILATPLYNRQGKFLAPNGGSTKDIALGSAGDWKDLPAYKFLDFNNDGLSDLVKFNFSKTQPVTGNIYMNTGNMFGDMLSGSGVGDNTTQVFTLTEAGEDEANAHNTTFVDINGDGQPDILKYLGGDGDPKDPTKTYFDTFIHTGNTFAKGKSTNPFGAHTRNVVSSMGDNPLASIVSVTQQSGQVDVSVFMNTIEPPRQELISIDNGAGLVYGIDYEKLSPFVDYANIKQPTYPNILLSKVRMVASGYSETKNKGTSYGYSVAHTFDYMFPIYNRHDWMFSGYSKVQESIKSLDKFILSRYSNTYPTRGKILSKTVGQLSTGVAFTQKESTYNSIPRYPKVDPAVSLVYKSGMVSTTYQDSNSGNESPIAFQKTYTYGVDSVWGVPLWSSSQYLGGEALFKCYRYTVNDGGKSIFTIGDKTGTLFTTDKTQCDAFAGNKAFNAPYKRIDADLDLLLTQYSTDGLFNPIMDMVYSSENKGYATKSLVYDKKGNVIQTTESKDYTDLTGKYPKKENLVVTDLTFDANGYVSKQNQGGLVTLSTVDPRFATKVSSTSVNGAVTTHDLNSLGSVINTKLNDFTVSSVSFGSDDEGSIQVG